MKHPIVDASMHQGSLRDKSLTSRLCILFADFPRTLDQRVYHLGLRAGEVANRIVRP